MAENKFDNLADEKLVGLAGSTVVGTPSGLKAQYAQAELTRRLMNSINNFNKETSRYSEKIIDLTLLLFFLALIQVIVSFGSISASWKEWAILSAVVLYFINYIIKYIDKSRKKSSEK